MANIEAQLRLEIAQYQQALARAEGQTARFKAKVQQAGSGLGGSLFGGLGGFVAGGTMIALGKQALDVAVQMDRMKRAMINTAGGAKEAEMRLAELREMAKLPGIGFEQAVQGDIRLRSVGVSAEQSARALAEFGNELANSGGSGEDLDGIVVALSQIAAKGNVFAEEINQIAERVPGIRRILKDAFGTADTEAIQAMGLSFDDFLARILDVMGQSKRAVGGLDESLSDISTTLKTAVADMATPLAEELVPAFAELLGSINDNREAVIEFGEGAVTVAREIGSAFKVAGEAIGTGLFALFGDNSEIPLDPKLAARLTDAQKAQFASGQNGGRLDVASKALFDREQERKARIDDEKKKPTPGTGGAGGSPTTPRPPLPVVANKKQEAELERISLDIARQRAALEEKKFAAGLQQLSLGGQQQQIAQKITQLQERLVNLPMHEADKLKLEQEIVDWQLKGLSVQEQIASARKSADEEAAQKADEQKAKMEELNRLADETAILQARAAGDTKKADALQRELDLATEAKRIAEATGASEEKAMQLARQRQGLEDQIAKNGEEKTGKVSGYSATRQGGAEAARARAAGRVAAADARVGQRMKDSFGGLDEYEAMQGTRLADTFAFPSLDAMKGPMAQRATEAGKTAAKQPGVESKLDDMIAVLQAGLLSE